MDWENEGLNQVTTDISSVDERSLILPGAFQFENSAYTTALLDDADQSNEFLPAQYHFGNLCDDPQSAICTEPQTRSDLPNPLIFHDLQYGLSPGQMQSGYLSHTIHNQQSLATPDHSLHNNVFSLDLPQFYLSADVFDDPQTLDLLHNQPQSNAFSLPQSQVDIFDDPQTLNLLDAFPLPQPEANILDDPQTLNLLLNQPQSSAFSLQQSQSGNFLNNQSSSTIVPLTPASVECHGTGTALVTHDPGKLNRQQKSCIGCRVQKIKCKKNTSGILDPRCLRCASKCFPWQMCIQLRITEFKVFEKWLNEMYERQFTLVVARDLTSQRTAELTHYPHGPFLLVKCCKFHPTDHYQTRALRKNLSGWHAVDTTAFCLVNTKMDISAYVSDCTRHAIDDACKRGDIASPFFKLACDYRDEPVIQRCFEMYTALCLIMVGCQFSGTRKERIGAEDDYLDMTKVEDRNSAWFGCTPVPRMVTNQLNHQLELRIGELDSEILKEVANLLERRERHMWVVGILACFMLLHTREIDTGRNIFWQRFRDTLGFWIHPHKPQTLIGEATASCNALLTTFHHTIGKTPLSMDWDDKKSRDIVNNDSRFLNPMKFINSMKTLQNCVCKLNDMIGRKACDVYNGNPRSVAFTASSLMFARVTDGCVVEGVY